MGGFFAFWVCHFVLKKHTLDLSLITYPLTIYYLNALPSLADKPMLYGINRIDSMSVSP
ncbi:hypothetical protein M2263_002516 [Providencia alcalifaciens]|nr:hypothetical protein [Providencia alcalifaciens]